MYEYNGTVRTTVLLQYTYLLYRYISVKHEEHRTTYIKPKLDSSGTPTGVLMTVFALHRLEQSISGKCNDDYDGSNRPNGAPHSNDW